MKTLIKKIGLLALGGILSCGRGRQCPLCNWTGFQFLPRLNKRVPASDANCPRCGSAERHRFAYEALRSRLPLSFSILHFAPERQLEAWLRGRATHYTSCDILPGRAMEVQDITNLSYAEKTFDITWCSHVLEHVEDDHAALNELYRVTKVGGMCVIQVPIWRRKSFEDPGICSSKDRLEHFGRGDHVRLYGFDIEERIEEVGFRVETIITRDFDPREVARYGLNNLTTSELFLCYRDGKSE